MSESPVGGPASARGVNGLVMNLIVPGLGSLYCGRTRIGAGQLALFGAGVLSCLTLLGVMLGIGLMVAAWVWSAIVGFQLMSGSSA
jgi:hypothetical protein